MLERLRLFRDRDKSRDNGTVARDSKSSEKAKGSEVKRQRASSNDGRCQSEPVAASTAATTAASTASSTAAPAPAPNGGYKLSEQVRERIQRRVQFSTSLSSPTATTKTKTTTATAESCSTSVASTNDRYTELLSKLEKRQRFSSATAAGQQRRYEGSDSGGSGSPYSRLRLLGLGASGHTRPSDSADEAARGGGRYRGGGGGGSGGGYGSGGYASDGYASEGGVYYGVVTNLVRPSLQKQQQQQQQKSSRCPTSVSQYTQPQPQSLSHQQYQRQHYQQPQQQQQLRGRRRCYGSADECDEDSKEAAAAASVAAEAAEAAAAASQCRLRATGASLCLSDVESCGPGGGSLLRQRRQVGRQQQQRCSDSIAGSLSDNESATASLTSAAQQQRWRAMEGVHLPYPGGSSAGRFASLDRAGLNSTSLLSPTSTAAERRAREIRQLRWELAEARHRASSLSAALSHNASAVSAFERRLGGASARLRELTTSAQRGDAEIDRLRAAIEQMRAGTGSDAGPKTVNLVDMPVGTAGSSSSVMLIVTVDAGDECLTDDDETPLPIGRLRVGTAAVWSELGTGARQMLREFAVRVDPPGGLGLGVDSVAVCRLVGCNGDSLDVDWAATTATSTTPYQQLAASASDCVSRCQLRLTLRSFNSAPLAEEAVGSAGQRASSLDALAFATLVPKAVLQRYVCLLSEHRRLVLCGPAGTGKTYLSRHLARHMARLEGCSDTSAAVADFSGESRRSEQELRAFLAEAVSHSGIEIESKRRSSPRGVQVLLLDSLQHLAPLAEARSGLAASRLYIICTVRRGLRQLQALDDGGIGGEVGFRWLLCANHLEPVRGLLGRHLRRQRLIAEASEPPSRSVCVEPSRRHQLDDWLPGAWQRVNAFLEARCGGPDATLGPGPLLSCPLEPAASRDWFVSLWNHALAPRLLAASASASSASGTADDWEDPTDWVLSTWPWPELPPGDGELVRLRPQTAASDPLMLMLMKLREAAAATSRGEADAV